MSWSGKAQYFMEQSPEAAKAYVKKYGLDNSSTDWMLSKPGGMLSNIGQGIGNAFQGIKQGMANQGAMNRATDFFNSHSGAGRWGYKSPADMVGNYTNQAQNLKNFAQAPMAIPALGGALGTGAVMAGGAGLGLGLLGNWALREYGSTLVKKQEADIAQRIARALEAAQMNSSRDRNQSPNGTNHGGR